MGERAAGTFQDRLVTELRLAAAETIDQATTVLQDFLPRYNARFAVQPEHPEPAYRPAGPDLVPVECQQVRVDYGRGQNPTLVLQSQIRQTAFVMTLLGSSLVASSPP